MSERARDHLIDALFLSLGLALLCAALVFGKPWLLLGLIPLAFAGASFLQKLFRYGAARRRRRMDYQLPGNSNMPTKLRP